MGSHSSPGHFPDPVIKPIGLLHRRQILYLLSHKIKPQRKDICNPKIQGDKSVTIQIFLKCKHERPLQRLKVYQLHVLSGKSVLQKKSEAPVIQK